MKKLLAVLLAACLLAVVIVPVGAFDIVPGEGEVYDTTFKVTFVDYDGTVLKESSVEFHHAAVAPADPERADFTFVGWDKDFSDITAELVVTAVYRSNKLIYGDATGDTEIDSKDVVRLRKYLAAYDFETQTSTVDINPGGDANGDGTIDSKDVVRLRKYLAAYDFETGQSTVKLGPETIGEPGWGPWV